MQDLTPKTMLLLPKHIPREVSLRPRLRRLRLPGNASPGHVLHSMHFDAARPSGVARYLVLNPVRAGIVEDAGLWPWSSYAAMVGATSVPDWLEVEWKTRPQTPGFKATPARRRARAGAPAPLPRFRGFSAQQLGSSSAR
jgi:hypothetical protein